MKKVFLLILIMLLCSCSINKQDSSDNIDNSTENIINNQTKVETYKDDNEIKLGLFHYDNNYQNKERIEDTYYANFISGSDIGSFEVFLTDDKVINGTNFKNTWNTYYDKYDNIENHKIGFNIKFILSDGTNFSANYLEPDTYKFSEYFYTYLYDDIHQEDGSYYSHIEKMEENTLLTSIKIYAVEGIDKVESFILSAFTYDTEDDFDSEGNYRGNSIYVIRIKRK